nr:calreticulin isoform X2 [Ipomoea batatas]
MFIFLQVKSGTLFDNVLVSDDPEYAKKLAEETWAKNKDGEKAAFDEAEKKKAEEVILNYNLSLFIHISFRSSFIC